MLQILRNKAQSTIIQGLVLIIALVFIFWGIGNKLSSDRNTAISVNGEEISFQEFQRSYDQSITGYRRQFGDSISDEMLKQLGIKQQVTSQLIQAALLRQGAQSMGIMVAPAEIRTAIQKMPQFLQDGAFSMDNYKAILSANHLTPHKFETSISRDLLHEKAVNYTSNFATTVSAAEIKELHQRDQETVTVKAVKIAPHDFINTITVTPEDLAAWYEKEKNTYKTEQKIKLKYLSFPYKTQMDGITVSDEQILAHYEKNRTTYQVPEQRHARHILLKAETEASPEKQNAQQQKAKDILAKARAGADFASLAKTWSEDPAKANGGDLGTFARGRMIPEFDEAVFSMEEGGISDIVKTQFGYHIIKVEKILPAMTKPLEEVRAAITETLRAEQAKPATFQLANEAYEGIIAAGNLQAYAAQHPDRHVTPTDFFSRTTPPAELGRDPKFMDTIFTMKQGELSSLVETPAGYFILFADQIQEPTPPGLEEIKERVTRDYRLAMAEKKALETATTLLSKLKEGADFDSTLQENKLKAISSGPLNKKNATPDPAVPVSLVNQAMRLGAASPFPKEPLTVENDLYILKFVDRTLPDTASLDDAAKKEYTATLLRQKQDRLLGSWLKHQEKNAKIFTSKNL